MDGFQVSFQFQMGLVRDRVTVDTASLNLKSLKSKACDFISEKFPQNGLTRMDERILLFKHDHKSTNILQVSIVAVHQFGGNVLKQELK
jgi:protein kinase D